MLISVIYLVIVFDMRFDMYYWHVLQLFWQHKYFIFTVENKIGDTLFSIIH